MLKIDVKGLEEVRTTLEGLAGTRAIGIVTEAAADEVVDIMHKQPADTPYSYISRANAYPDAPAGPGWFSAKQRRYVIWKIKNGDISIPYNRAGRVSEAWRKVGKLSKARVINDNQAAPFVFGDTQQSRHEDAVGWQKVSVRIDENSNKIFDAAYSALEKWLSSRK